MSLRQTTREIITRVEQVSGMPVYVTQNVNLPTLASVQMARGAMPAHVVTYKPSTGEPPDYLIVFECGFILRHFANAPEDRVDITSTEQGRDDLMRLLLAPDGSAARHKLGATETEQLGRQLLDGLLIHLRSVPIGLRVSTWIRNEYPEFHDLQHAQVLKELEINRQTLQREIREMTPDKVYPATLAINAAFALFWAQVYDEPDLTAGYRTGREEQAGRALLKLWNDTPDISSYDSELIDAWGAKLGLTDWYRWIPYHPA